MRATHIVGPITGRTYQAHDTGETWNGAPVLGFTQSELHALVEAGDGLDANGNGLGTYAGEVVDFTGPQQFEDVAVRPAVVAGRRTGLYVPAGRLWDEETPNSTVGGIGYGLDNCCRACGEHITDPHAPACPAAVAARLREGAEASAAAHAATLTAGAYTARPCLSMTEGDEPAEVSHHFLEVAQRGTADLVEMDHVGAIDLGAWPEAAQFVACVSGEAHPRPA